jgi:error-prone DNA polymerase
MGEHLGETITMAGWWITGKPVSTKHGQPMEFVTFEDTKATFETTFFPRAYARFCQRLTRHRPYLLRGRVEEEFGVATLNVQWVGTIDSVESIENHLTRRHGDAEKKLTWRLSD